jgi:superfamily II DNA or RNA helicase
VKEDYINGNETKDEIQTTIINRWLKDFLGKGYLVAVTGFGKTFVGLKTISRLTKAFPKATTNVVVPTTYLKKQWEDRISQFKLPNVTVYVVNTYVTEIRQSELLILDEAHRYSRIDAQFFSKVLEVSTYKYIWALSATFSKEEKQFLEAHNLQQVAEIKLEEAKAKGWISDYINYNLGVTLPFEEQQKIKYFSDVIKSKFSLFEGNYALLKACGCANDSYFKVGTSSKTGRQWREYWAKLHGWKGEKEHQYAPDNLRKHSAMFSHAERNRKELLYKTRAKMYPILELVKKFNTEKIIIFSERTSFADEMAKLIGKEAGVYHSQLKTITKEVEVMGVKKTVKLTKDKQNKATIEAFIKGDIRVLCTANAVDEGLDVEDISIGIIASRKSTTRQTIQRTGRVVRAKEGKQALVINVFAVDTQDQIWLEKAQAESDYTKTVFTVDDVEYITETAVFI